MLTDEKLCGNINLYLQELGSHIAAKKLVQFLAQPEIKEKHRTSKTTTLETGWRYLKKLGLWFTYAKKDNIAMDTNGKMLLRYLNGTGSLPCGVHVTAMRHFRAAFYLGLTPDLFDLDGYKNTLSQR